MTFLLREDYSALVLTTLLSNATEADVETQIVLPILRRTEYLGIELSSIKSKEFLAAFDIGKGQKSRKGYIPDFCVYILSIPIVVIEVKAPSVPISAAWEEASLYAHALNKGYPARANPCEVLFATNGLKFCAGSWDNSVPELEGNISDLIVGSSLLNKLQAIMGYAELERLGALASASMKLVGFKRPFNQGNGPAMIASKLESNTFAADLSPILRRFFSSRDQNKDPVIYKNAYVSSNEITSYDRVLESFLVDRLSRSRSRVEIQTTKNRAENVTKRINDLVAQKSPSGELQLVTGGVGSGKSLFARRYKEFLQPSELKKSSHWAFLDFNLAPENLSDASEWVYTNFVKSLIEEGAPLNLRDADDQERIFAADLSDREAYYQRMETSEAGRGLLEKARDIESWRQDPEKLALGLARRLQGDRGEVVIAVFDNVDRRDVANQLAAFQLALWFMEQVRCLVILQMRDSTFEAHKNERPLDTYKTGQIFHISPPRFIDVVKRRLELSLTEVQASAPKTIKYQTPSGANISYSKDKAGDFLRGVYLELFQRPTNISRILEALAGRNVRKALDMFMAIINSGHMPEDLIATVASGQQIRKFPEYLILRILMRQDYRFFSEASGFVANILYCGTNWVRPNNFLVCEILFYLIGQRKVNGDNGQMGYVSVGRLQDKLEKFGYVRSDILDASQYLLEKELIEADSATAKNLSTDASVKASAAGWAHLRILSSRSEYIVSLLATTPINDPQFEARIFDLMQTENRSGRLYQSQYIQLLTGLQLYLKKQFDTLKSHPGYAESSTNGAVYLLSKVSEALSFASKSNTTSKPQMDWLDS